MTKPKIDGVVPAMPTPFLEDGLVDMPRFERNLQFLTACGIKWVAPCGTTGESPTLSWEDQSLLIQQAVFMCKRLGVKVLAGTGSNNTREAMLYSSSALEFGADGILLVDGGYYNRVPSIWLRDHYYAPIAHNALLTNPEAIVVPYIIPARTCTQLYPVDLKLLANQFPNVCAVKDATGKLAHASQIRDLLTEDFSIMSGDDDWTAKVIMSATAKANGVISVMANIVPTAITAMVEACNNGRMSEAATWEDRLAPLFGCVGIRYKTDRGEGLGSEEDFYPNPTGLKTMMNILGIDTGVQRAGLSTLEDTGYRVVRQALIQAYENCAAMFEPLAGFYGVNVKQRLGI